MPLDIDLESDSKNPSNFVLNDVFDTMYTNISLTCLGPKRVFFSRRDKRELKKASHITLQMLHFEYTPHILREKGCFS